MATIKTIDSINYPFMEHIVNQDLTEGDLIIVKYPKTIKLVTVEKVKVSESDGIEIIYDLINNHYFNLSAYKNNKSFVQDLYRIKL